MSPPSTCPPMFQPAWHSETPVWGLHQPQSRVDQVDGLRGTPQRHTEPLASQSTAFPYPSPTVCLEECECRLIKASHKNSHPDTFSATSLVHAAQSHSVLNVLTFLSSFKNTNITTRTRFILWLREIVGKLGSLSEPG